MPHPSIGAMPARRAAAVAAILTVVGTRPCMAVYLDGHGNPGTECYVGLEVEGRRSWEVRESVAHDAITTNPRKARVVQKSCGNSCEFNLRLCANVPRSGCTPTPLEARISVTTDIRGYSPQVPELDGTPNSCADRPQPIQISLGKHKRVSRRLVITAQSTERKRRDRDVVVLVCERSDRLCCGDQQVTGAEECDDGNRVNGDGCDSNCTRTACGNGITDDHEECDDGNQVSGDECDEN